MAQGTCARCGKPSVWLVWVMWQGRLVQVGTTCREVILAEKGAEARAPGGPGRGGTGAKGFTS